MAASSDEVVVTYVGQKVSKVRWAPVLSGRRTSDIFVSGSWDDLRNSLKLWRCTFATAGVQSGQQFYPEPNLLHTMHVKGDVMDIETVCLRWAARMIPKWGIWLHPRGSQQMANQFLAALGSGDVELFQANDRLTSVHCWVGVHVQCTAVSHNQEGKVASAGEDGRLVVHSLGSGEVEQSIEGTDGACINALQYVTTKDVVHVSSSGLFVQRDLRTAPRREKPKALCLPDRPALHSLAQHPSRTHMVATGSADGSLAVWDLRQEKMPVGLIAAHQSIVWDVRFHPTQPDLLFTSSQDGSVWKWVEEEQGAWPKYETGFYQPQRTMPVNSVDIETGHLLCGTDGEAIFVYPNCVSW